MKIGNAAIIIVWFVMWMLTWPALFADLQGIGGCKYSSEEYRHQLAFSMFFAAVPVTWLVAPFTTGFYKHGFQFGRRECDARTPA